MDLIVPGLKKTVDYLLLYSAFNDLGLEFESPARPNVIVRHGGR